MPLSHSSVPASKPSRSSHRSRRYEVAAYVLIALGLSPWSARAESNAPTGAATTGGPSSPPTPAVAPQGSSPTTASDAAALTEDARARFKRGIELYHERDFRSALIEFNRAYAEAPNYRVLYNVGQTCLELQDYACAMKSYSRYLDEGGEAVSGARRDEVVANIAKLKARVSNVTIEANVPGAEIFVDDVPVGRQPLAGPVMVSAGRRKFSASHGKSFPATRVVDLAGGDAPVIRLELVPIPTSGTPTSSAEGPKRPGTQSAPFWIAVGTTTVATAAAVTFGILALGADKDRDRALGTFPTTAEALDSARTRVTRFTVATDVAGAVAFVGLGASLYFGLRSTNPERRAGVRVGPSHLSLEGSF